MDITLKRTYSAALKSALAGEHLWSKDAASYFNLNPCYVSMMLNDKFFDKASNKAWSRLEEWYNSKCKISDFKIPSGEPLWNASESKTKAPKKTKKAKELKDNKLVLVPPSEEEAAAGISGKINVDSELIDKVPKEAFSKDIPGEKLQTELDECARLKVVLDIEINLHVNGTKVLLA